MEIDGRTRVIPHLAYPAAHLRTPTLFNARCRELGLNAVLVPWEVAPANLAGALEGLRHAENIPGMIVTIPHKEAVADLCDALDGVAGDLRVANIVRKGKGGDLIGHLYDGFGFVAGMRAEGISIDGRRVLLLGAGGAATALAQALVDASAATLVVANRNEERAARLVARLKALYPGRDIRTGRADATGFDIVANGTSVGLDGDPSIPLDPSTIAPGTCVAEVIMKPVMTPLLVAAQARGARIHLGEHMLTAQIDLFIDALLSKPPAAPGSPRAIRDFRTQEERL